ncbi:M1 family metallopeptidase [Terrimonas ferruginea]|uniref:M1 family metallopeptidase n=1 Tax=Terrimonas ferruginea TaxID=249 RepID=UPI0004191A70|nr:M1 family metallopeptidase [Terrimonas ferruginea]
MKKFLLAGGLLSLTLLATAQHRPNTDTSWKKVYRESATRINDLVHTKLDVKFDYSKSYLNGKAWITLKPHFYATDSLTLDAKGMDIRKVAIAKGSTLRDLKYRYDNKQLFITLDKTYKGGESYTIYLDYTAKPDELEAEGSAAITDAKGLYFVNPLGKEKNKPTQIWTQGETEASSVWFPTIDKPNQKTTQEIYMTVPAKYVTLSNGKLTSQKKNADGTRTDYWKMDLPHAPYLFFMGVGEYAVVRDSYKGKEVSYYVEKEYEPVARRIFGHTPEMMAFFSKITGVDYPWIKYAQITGRDYVSGAMENTTATLHQESAQQDARELVDGNHWEGTIAHELFHHWFGDYVTAESWSNLTINESFANYSEYLWNEYKYGKDDADDHNFDDMSGYLQSNSGAKDLVRFQYRDKEDMFDAVSYNKGGRILHMLRNYVGDSAFFKSLNLFLVTNKFKTGEAHQLRLAFEEVTGRDLNWFFNQWYFGSGNPSVDIDYMYDDAAGTVKVIVRQTQKSGKVFQLPIAIDVYNGAQKTRYNVLADNMEDTFTIRYTKRPDLINVDGDKVMLWTKKDNKTLDNFIHQYKYAGSYLDRREAIDYASKYLDNDKAVAFLKTALADKYEGLRSFALSKLTLKNEKIKADIEPLIARMAKEDKKPAVRARAIRMLGEYNNPAYAAFFKGATNDSSYTVAGYALSAYSKVDEQGALALAKELNKKPSRGALKAAVMSEILKAGDESMFDEVIGGFETMGLQEKFDAVGNISTYIAALKNTDKVKRGIDAVVKFREEIPASYRTQTDPYINGMVLKGILAAKSKALEAQPTDAGLKAQVDYIKAQLSEEDKKGF